MTFYIGVDLHPYQQTLCWCDQETGETGSLKLAHDIEKVRRYYSSIGKPAVAGIEASSLAGWFERIVAEAGHKLLVGYPASKKTGVTSAILRFQLESCRRTNQLRIDNLEERPFLKLRAGRRLMRSLTNIMAST